MMLSVLSDHTRLVDPDCHREAIISRLLLLNAVGKLTQHGRTAFAVALKCHYHTDYLST